MKCTITRMKISGALEGAGQVDKGVLDHLAECGACRQFRSDAMQIAAQMESARGGMEKVEPKLHQQIMVAVANEAGIHRKRAMSLSEYMLKTIVPIAVAASLAVALMVFVSGQAGGSRDAAGVAALNQDVTSCLNSYDNAVMLVNSAVNVPVDAPYQNEIGNIKNDIASAGNFFSGCYSYAGVLE